MVTIATDNIVRFPESNRDSIGNRDRLRTLRESRDLVAQKLREAVRSLVDELGEELGVKGDQSDERDQRNFYYGGRELLRENQTRLEGLFAGHWLKLFDRALGATSDAKPVAVDLSSDQLELVDLGDMDEQLAVRGLASRLQDGCEEGLFAAGRRLSHLAGRDDGHLALDSLLADAAHAALKESALPGPLRVEVLGGLECRCVNVLGPVIHDLNAFLVGRRVLPTVRRSYTRAQPKSPADTQTAGGAPADVFALLQRLVSTGAGSVAVPATIAAASGVLSSAGGVGIGGGGIFGGLSGATTMAPEAMAAAMQRVMVSLDALQHSLPPSSAISVSIPTTNVLREFRGSEVGQGLDHLDAVTVDIVATLFDFIFDDNTVSDPIKALIGRLQIPVLKVAMLDKSFFSSKQHPARRLLDSLSRAAARCGPEVGHTDPLYAHITTIVERLQTEFKQDAGLFDVLCGELNDFLENQENEADVQALKAAPLVAEQERRELAAVAADAVLAVWLTSPLPAAVADLLTTEWRSLLVRQYLRDDSEGWESAVNTATDLVASVAPVTDAAGRKGLAAKLPTLVKRIHDGLDLAGVTMERRVSLLDCMFSLHAAVLRGAAPIATTVWALPDAPAEPAIVAESIEADGALVQRMSLLDAANVPVLEDDSDAQRRVDELQRGDWVEFPGGESGAVRYRLSWVSPERGILLFTNPHSPRALSVAPAALALQLERGEAAIVPVEPIFERAVNRALETLKAA
ncbi:MAG: DUF1631 family protein [Rhodocyclales bacterium]|nr:DUF1631 family protein [Rhodocyclales bacterium]